MSTLHKVLFLQKAAFVQEHHKQIQQQLQAEFPNLDIISASNAEEISDGLHVDAVIAPTIDWLPLALSRLGSYRWIHFLSAGIEIIWDMPFEKKNVLLTKSSGVHGVPMSEYAIGAMLYFAKHFDQFVHQMADRRWQRAWLDELTDKTLTIVGMGHVGGFVARRAKSMGMRVIGVQRNPREHEFADESLALQNLHDYLPKTDYLVICLPLTQLTRGLVDQQFLSKLKSGAVLVDISRGGVVQEGAVLAALMSGRLRGAALDVFEQEPLTAESQLWTQQNVLLTPHVSGTSPHYMRRAIEVFIQNARDLEAGRPLTTAVDIDERY